MSSTTSRDTATRVTYPDALKQAVQLRRQGATYPEIAEHLAKIGYRSPKTRAPLKEMAVRLMVTDYEKKEAAEREASGAEDRPMYVTTDERAEEARLRERLRTLATLPLFTPEQRLTLVLAVLNEGRLGSTASQTVMGATKAEA